MSAPAINRGPTRRATRHAYKSQDGLPPELVPPVTAMRHAGRSPELLDLIAAYNASVATAVEANRGRDRRDRLRDALVVRDGAAS